MIPPHVRLPKIFPLVDITTIYSTCAYLPSHLGVYALCVGYENSKPEQWIDGNCGGTNLKEQVDSLKQTKSYQSRGEEEIPMAHRALQMLRCDRISYASTWAR